MNQNAVMLTSTKRRILNVISVSMAICCVAYGLVLRYDNSPFDGAVVLEGSDPQEEIVKSTPAIILNADNQIADPNN